MQILEFLQLVFFQFSSYATEPDEYALSKDVDVALWLDYRSFHEKPSLQDLGDFVIISLPLHAKLDLFKKAEIKPLYSLLAVNELLQFYSLCQSPHLIKSRRIEKYGKAYLELHLSEIDQLIPWVEEKRNEYHESDGEKIFTESTAFQSMLDSSKSSCCDPISLVDQVGKQAEVHAYASVCMLKSAKRPSKNQLSNERKKCAKYLLPGNLDVNHFPREIHQW